MFKKTKQVLREMWEEGKIYRDPAPMPWDKDGKGLIDLAKALYNDVKDILEPNRDSLTNNY